MTAKDLTVGKQYWLDDAQDVSGVCVGIDIKEGIVSFDPVPNQPMRYLREDDGTITFPVDVPYEYQEVEA